MTTIKLTRTDSDHPDFKPLVKLLDADLAIRDGEDHAFYAGLNRIEKKIDVVLAYDDTVAVGCGAFRDFEPRTVEVKRMFVHPEARHRGIASAILRELETWASEKGFNRMVLETGTKQPEAISLYEKCGYIRIPNYGHYFGVTNSICFEKKLG